MSIVQKLYFYKNSTLMKPISRRSFSSTLVKGVGAVSLAAHLPLTAQLASKKEKIGIALVGLGGYSTYQLAPALQDTQYCYLAGIVTGTQEKEKVWAEQYNIPKKNIYNYKNFDTIANNPDIDVVYVVLPNAMHADFCIRAAKAGKHVICEKPMAVSVEECNAIIAACKEAGVTLGMGYRLHSEPYTNKVKELVANKTFGAVQFASADAAYYSAGNPDQWRLNKTLSGGGALMNMGVYAIQSVIYGTGENPTSVSAQEFSTRPDYFKDTDETITAQFTFPSGATAQIMTSHNANANRLYVSCREGFIELQPANNYGPLHGKTSKGELNFPHESQQKLQMDDFAKHLLHKGPNKAPGEMGLRDMMIVEAIYTSIAKGGTKIPLSFDPSFGFGG